MESLPNTSSEPMRYELRFEALSNIGRSYAFPCDAAGRVDLDALSNSARSNYLYARAVVGRDLSFPAVISSRVC